MTRFLHSCHNKPLHEINRADVEQFLTNLTVERNVSASTQNAALNAIVYWLTQVQERPREEFSFRHAKRGKHYHTPISAHFSHAEFNILAIPTVPTTSCYEPPKSLTTTPKPLIFKTLPQQIPGNNSPSDISNTLPTNLRFQRH